MALPLDGAGSTAGVLESCAKEMGPVKRSAIAMNASTRLASELQALLGQNAVALLKTVLRMGCLLMRDFFKECKLQNHNPKFHHDIFLLTRMRNRTDK
jgi:hypothetical protein